MSLEDAEMREIVRDARSLSFSDDAVQTYGIPVRSGLSSLLFCSEACYSSQAVPDGNVVVRLEVAPVTFEGQGEGYIHFDVVADPETYEVESLTVRSHLD